MDKRLSFNIKKQMVELAGACFWFWNDFYSFLASSGVPSSLYDQFPKQNYNKYDAMRGILGALEEQGDFESINRLISNFYQLDNAVNPEKLDTEQAKKQLAKFREIVGDDPIEAEIQRRKHKKARAEYCTGSA